MSTPAPAFRLPQLSGEELTLEALAARGPFLLTFFKISCPICQMTLPWLQRLHDSGALPVYAVSQNDRDDTLDFNREFGLTLPTLLDSEEDDFPASNAYGIQHVPTSFLISPDSTITKVIEGWDKAAFASLSALAPGPEYPERKAG